MARPRALVVDDHALNLELAAFVLAGGSFEVATAADADAAHAQLHAFRPDVVLLDIQLPQVDGLTLAARWKADPATRHVVIIAFTAYAMKGDEARMLQSGCDGYLAKPIEVGRFAEQVLDIMHAAGWPHGGAQSRP
jgi:CheY-like chemotaxis protein